MRIYLASKRWLLVSGTLLALGLGLLLPASAKANGARHGGPTTWTVSGPVTAARISGGPWTLGQGPATYGTPTAGYCDASGRVTRNPGTELFQPAYFPNVTGSGQHLTGFFDYRPKDTDEAVIAASSDDGGHTWTYQGKALESNPGLCPDATLNDDGQGHPTLVHVNGHDYLYTLDRPTADAPGSQLLVHRVDAGAENPLQGLPTAQPVGTSGAARLTTDVLLPSASIPVATTVGFEIPGTVRVQTTRGLVDVRCASQDGTALTGCVGGSGFAATGAIVETYPVVPKGTEATSGLINPDGILGVLPGTHGGAVTVLYVSKELDYYTSPTQSGACDVPYAMLAQIGEGSAEAPFFGNNEDRSTVRMASTKDGIAFTDKGPVAGLGDNADPSATATRFVSPSGSVVKNPDGTLGLFFAAGNCYDGDSDGFHYIGYATSKDSGKTWSIVNGFDNPLLSVNTAFPSILPDLFSTGRVYSPQVIPAKDGKSATLVFAGYRTPKPLPDPGSTLGTNPRSAYTVGANDLAAYRTILTTTLSAG